MAASSLAILLDLDGTVVDSKPGIKASCAAALSALGHPTENLEIEVLIGLPLEEIMKEVLRRFRDDRVGQAVHAYRDHYGRAGFRETTVYPGLEATLDGLLRKKARLFIATSKRRVFAERILQHLGLIDRFVGVHGSEADGTFDHKSDLIAHVLNQHDLSASQCLMIGDRRHDAEGARENGVPTVGVLWGYGTRPELEAAGVQYIAAEPSALIPIMEARSRGLGR